MKALGAAIVLLFSSVSFAATYSGSLTYTPPNPPGTADELFVGPGDLQWVTYTVSVSWTVTDVGSPDPNFPWKYTYTFGHNGPQAGISHVIIEASDGIEEDNITDLTGAEITSVGLQTVLSGNPNMPSNLTGIRFNPLTTPSYSMTWSFYSNRQPVWGDFYARCGGKQGGINYAYNYNKDAYNVERGFLASDTDPTALPSNGSVDFHLLVPDSVIPEPATLSLIGLGGLALLRRRR